MERRRRPPHARPREPPDDRSDGGGPDQRRHDPRQGLRRGTQGRGADARPRGGRARPRPGRARRHPDAGLPALADPEYLEGMQMVAPGIGPVLGVRQPLLRAVGSGLRAATRGVPSSTRLDIAARLVREPVIELHWIAYGLLERTIRDEPERTWQLVRAESRAAHEWATVDALAHVASLGIVAEPYRWAELEQLVYSPVALGAPPRRLHDRDAAVRGPRRRPPPRDRRARPADPGRPHGRRLAGRPEVALVGDPLPDHRRSPGHGRVPARRGQDRPSHR